jgi:hypothetical protein
MEYRNLRVKDSDASAMAEWLSQWLLPVVGDTDEGTIRIPRSYHDDDWMFEFSEVRRYQEGAAYVLVADGMLHHISKLDMPGNLWGGIDTGTTPKQGAFKAVVVQGGQHKCTVELEYEPVLQRMIDALVAQLRLEFDVHLLGVPEPAASDGAGDGVGKSAHEAAVSGSGAVAQGSGVAAGERAIVVVGDNSNVVINNPIPYELPLDAEWQQRWPAHHTVGGPQQMTNSQTGTGPVRKRATIHLWDVKKPAYPDDNFVCAFRVSVVDSRFVGHPSERSKTFCHKIKIGMTWELRVNWGLDSDDAKMDVVKVLFRCCGEHVEERLREGHPLENELLLTTQNSPKYRPDISHIADPANPISFDVSVYRQRTEISADDIDSFSEARNIKPEEVKALLPLDLPEDKIQTFFEEIVGENFHQKDWGGELDDLLTSQIRVGGKRIRAAFLLKGSGTRGKLTIAKCGKNGDQIGRLTQAPADLYVIQHVEEIDESVIGDLRGRVELKVRKGEICQMCILNGTDTARILRAYKKL